MEFFGPFLVHSASSYRGWLNNPPTLRSFVESQGVQTTLSTETQKINEDHAFKYREQEVEKTAQVCLVRRRKMEDHSKIRHACAKRSIAVRLAGPTGLPQAEQKRDLLASEECI